MFSAVICIAILSIASALHAYWAMGGVAWRGSVIPEKHGKPVFSPGRLGTLLVAVSLAAAALLIAIQSQIIPWWSPTPITKIATWVLSVIFILRAIGDFRYVGFFKKVRGSSFSRLDTVLYSPLCGLLGILIADVAT